MSNKNFLGLAIFALLLFLLSGIFCGCSSTETIIKPKEIEIVIPEYLGIAKPEMLDTATIWLPDGQYTIEELIKYFPDSTVIKAKFPIPQSKDSAEVKVYPKEKKAELFLPEQKATTTIQDTTKYTIKKTTTTPEKFGYALYGIIAFIVIIVIAGVIIYIKKIKGLF